MVEILRHMFGLCGEGHPSIWYLLGITPALFFLRTYFMGVWRGVKTVAKSYLRRQS